MQITESPCVQICIVDPASRLCVGCGRTIDEITAWAAMAPDQRRTVMAALPARLAALDLPPAAPRQRTGRRRLVVRG